MLFQNAIHSFFLICDVAPLFERHRHILYVHVLNQQANIQWLSFVAASIFG